MENGTKTMLLKHFRTLETCSFKTEIFVFITEQKTHK